MFDYLMLKEYKQITTLIGEGQRVAKLCDGGIYCALYSIRIFFVEVEYEKWTSKIVGRAIFQSGKQMEKHLSNP
jgi:hypothetical protein